MAQVCSLYNTMKHVIATKSAPNMVRFSMLGIPVGLKVSKFIWLRRFWFSC